MEGPDGAIVEYAGNHPAERFNHVHLYQDDPFCAQLWYQKHLNAPVMQGRTSPTPMTEANCKVARGPDRTWPSLEREGMFRTPRAAVMFGDVALSAADEHHERRGDEAERAGNDERLGVGAEIDAHDAAEVGSRRAAELM